MALGGFVIVGINNSNYLNSLRLKVRSLVPKYCQKYPKINGQGLFISLNSNSIQTQNHQGFWQKLDQTPKKHHPSVLTQVTRPLVYPEANQHQYTSF